MENSSKGRGIFTKILAISGTALVWFPMLMAITFCLVRLIRMGRFNLDFLLPFELFPMILVGGGLILWAALRVRCRVHWIAWNLGVVGGLFFLTQGLAVITGLASGEEEFLGWRLGIVSAAIALFLLGEIGLGSAGVILIRDLCKPPQA
jgi:hypothetical protein